MSAFSPERRPAVSDAVRSEALAVADDGELKKKQELSADLEEFGVAYNPERSAAENRSRLRALQFLQERQLLSVVDGRLLFDVEGVKELRFHKTKGTPITSRDLLGALLGLYGYDKSAIDNPKFQEQRMPPKQVIAIPPNAESLTTTFPEQTRDALLNVWDIGKRIKWTKQPPITLESGETTNRQELFFAAKLWGIFGRLLLFSARW